MKNTVKIIFEPDYWKRPANGLVKALQERLHEILLHPSEFGVKDAVTLKRRMELEAEKLALEYRRSPLRDIKFNVRSHGDYDDQWFEMEHRKDNMALSATCHFDLGEKKFYPEWAYASQEGPFGKVVVEF